MTIGGFLSVSLVGVALLKGGAVGVGTGGAVGCRDGVYREWLSGKERGLHPLCVECTDSYETLILCESAQTGSENI